MNETGGPTDVAHVHNTQGGKNPYIRNSSNTGSIRTEITVALLFYIGRFSFFFLPTGQLHSIYGVRTGGPGLDDSLLAFFLLPFLLLSFIHTPGMRGWSDLIPGFIVRGNLLIDWHLFKPFVALASAVVPSRIISLPWEHSEVRRPVHLSVWVDGA